MKQSSTTAITRENLAQAFWTLYQKKPIEQIRIHEITDLAGYNRATFYQYFQDIYDVLDYLEQELLEYVRDYALRNLNSPSLEVIVQNFTELYRTRGEELSLLLSEQGDPRFSDKLKASLAPIWAQVLDLPQREESQYIIEFTMSALLSTTTLWYKQNCQLPPQKLVQIIHPLISQGILPVVRAMELQNK